MAAEVAENFEYEDTAQVIETVAPVVAAELPDIKLFGRWSCDDVQVSDMSLQVSGAFRDVYRYYNLFISRITSPLKRNTLGICLTLLDDSP